MSACKGCGPCRQMTETLTHMRADLAAAIKERDEARSSADMAGAALYHSESDRDAANARADEMTKERDLFHARGQEMAEKLRTLAQSKLESLYEAAGGNATSAFLRQRDEANARADVAEKERDEWREHAEHDTESLDEAHDQLDEYRAALDAAEAGAGAWLAAAPRCSGEWLSGSGGHRVHGKCTAVAVWWRSDDMHCYCDAHIVEHDKPLYDEPWWADLARAALAGGAKKGEVLCGCEKGDPRSWGDSQRNYCSSVETCLVHGVKK